MKIYIGADHRGFNLKETLKPWLVNLGHEVIDCGNSIYDKEDDFPDYAFAVSDKVAAELDSRGLVICGSGAGVAIAANKVKGIRCATALLTADVRFNRTHDDINVLAVSADFTSEDQAKELVAAFLATAFSGEARHVRRLKKIAEREK